jgi:superfamily I DNA/RNA helicase
MRGLDAVTGIRYVCRKAELLKVIEENELSTVAFERLLSMSQGYGDIKSFLDSMTLNQDIDTLAMKAEKVSVMTLHAAKGLEFPVVFVSGCEQGLIPFARDGVHVDDMAEERRLFYVAMTRAMDILCLTYARKRSIYGTGVKRQRSFFIDDIEKKLTKVERPPVGMSVEKKPTQLELF